MNNVNYKIKISFFEITMQRYGIILNKAFLFC